MHIATIVFAVLALVSFIAYHVLKNIDGRPAALVVHIAWFWTMPLAFIAAVFSCAFE